jgi:hypothetical protein
MPRDVFIWAYERSAARYVAVRQSLGEPDPFRLKYRNAVRAVVAEIVRAGMDRKGAGAHIKSWAQAHIERADRERVREIVETELLNYYGSISSRGAQISDAARCRTAVPVRPTAFGLQPTACAAGQLGCGQEAALCLHEGNFARYQLRPAEFADWQDTWMRGKEQ